MLVGLTNMNPPPTTCTYFSPNTRNPDCTWLPPPLHEARKAQHKTTVTSRTSFLFFIAVSFLAFNTECVQQMIGELNQVKRTHGSDSSLDRLADLVRSR